MTVKTPWAANMGDVPLHLDYFEGSMFEMVEQVARKYPNQTAFDFMGKATSYREMVVQIEKCAKALKTIGIREGDRVTIAMPNSPQAIYMFYAVNLVGGIANMIHPLSAEKEIECGKVKVNGRPAEGTMENGYMKISRKWAKGDRIEVSLPMSLRAVSLPDSSDNYSFMYGPVVLAAETGRQEQLGMYADDSRGGHIAYGKQIPLHEMPVIVGDKSRILSNISKVEGKPLTFRLTGLAPERYAEMTLVPFSRLHECRYMVYWEIVSDQEWATRQEELARQEAEKAALALKRNGRKGLHSRKRKRRQDSPSKTLQQTRSHAESSSLKAITS